MYREETEAAEKHRNGNDNSDDELDEEARAVNREFNMDDYDEEEEGAAVAVASEVMLDNDGELEEDEEMLEVTY